MESHGETQESKEPLNPGEIMSVVEGRDLQACLSLLYFKLGSYTIQDCHQVATGNAEHFQTHIPISSFSLGYRRTHYSKMPVIFK